MFFTDHGSNVAVQVDVLTLVCTFHAYVKLLPIINTLRMCNSYGRDAAVTKLPREIVKLIEDHVTYEERLRIRRIYHPTFRCYQHVCDPEEHIDEERYLRFSEGGIEENYHEWKWGVSKEEIRAMNRYERLKAEMEIETDYWDYIHERLQHDFEKAHVSPNDQSWQLHESIQAIRELSHQALQVRHLDNKRAPRRFGCEPFLEK